MLSSQRPLPATSSGPRPHLVPAIAPRVDGERS
jgi:hypothetical protein